MPKDLGQRSVIEALTRKHTSILMRSTVLALVLSLLPSVDSLFTVQAQEDLLASPRTETGKSYLYSAKPAHSFHPIAYQSRRRKRLKRRRSRRPYFQGKGGGAAVSTKSGRVPIGSWGGMHMALQVRREGATFEIDCAHGSIEDLLKLDAQGRFNNRGVYVRERGGPEREGQQPDTHPARFTGWSDGKTMTLTIMLTDTGQTIGDFNLTLGSEPQITKCL